YRFTVLKTVSVHALAEIVQKRFTLLNDFLLQQSHAGYSPQKHSLIARLRNSSVSILIETEYFAT
ncbi:MAG: hypothetical protein K2G93_07540, partial [Rikenella sp.]|nr:hypothetical protein [Rikenella sp.]